MICSRQNTERQIDICRERLYDILETVRDNLYPKKFPGGLSEAGLDEWSRIRESVESAIETAIYDVNAMDEDAFNVEPDEGYDE